MEAMKAKRHKPMMRETPTTTKSNKPNPTTITIIMFSSNYQRFRHNEILSNPTVGLLFSATEASH
ncbi:hypothetical protein SESBI_00668 [Sesbania bispinosa]|nr:hypothetical protein SESBI_00668 [Sesbania bispinosa]